MAKSVVQFALRMFTCAQRAPVIEQTIVDGVLTVRFVSRGDVIRIFGAGYWRKGKQICERENQVHQRAPRKA